jgi:membrane protein DedA with SNARE-associated domain
LKALISQLISWYTAHLVSMGCPLIFLMMTMESTVLPLPSELVVPPAAHLAWTQGIAPFAAPGYAGIIGIIIAGTLGSWFGATLMYWAARIGGPPLLLRYGKYFGITPEKIDGAQRWASHYGSMGIFISRLLPVVRHLIGIPAGMVRMDYRLFSLYTVLGSGLWCAVLCWLGVKMGQDQELMKGEYHRIALWVGGFVVVLGGIYYVFVHRHMKKKA